MKQKTFDVLWENGIAAKAKQIVDDNLNLGLRFDSKSKERIFNEYCKLRDYTKVSYMRNPDGLLDRHKVCACLILAIAKSKPLVYEDDDVVGIKKIFNESLAMSIGLSLLYNFIISSNHDNIGWLKEGFLFPPTDRDATYQDLVCLMLYYDIKNNQYSILALSNILFMIEEYTKQGAIRND